MSPAVKKWTKFALRWGVAVGGIAWILSGMSFRDRVMVFSAATSRPVLVTVQGRAEETSAEFVVEDPDTRTTRKVSRDDVLTRSEPSSVRLVGGEKAKVLAIRPVDYDKSRVPEAILIERPDGATEWVRAGAIQGEQGGYEVRTPYPRLDKGINRLVSEADPAWLWLAVGVAPLTILITTLRWHLLLRGLEIVLPVRRAFVLNVVGGFYNNVLPGSTGGDLLKAYYAAKHTTHRTRVMSVLVDRVIGLLALIILGGSMAGVQWWLAARGQGQLEIIEECRAVAVGSAVLLTGVGLFVYVVFHPRLRAKLGVNWLLARLPMQGQVEKAKEAMALYRQRKGLVLSALAMSLPVHMTVVVSATFSGWAFGLPIHPFYYWVVVPVCVLAAAVPISPQGAGVMEFFAVHLTRSQGATISQAFALTMSIRLVGMLWNLMGGIFVLRGGYHAPTTAEQKELEQDTTVPEQA